MAEPPASSDDLYLFLAQELELKPSSYEKTFVMRDIRKALLKINSEGKRCLVIMDESHLMSDDVINGIRMLNNLEEGPIKLIQLLLLGQEELMEKINKPEMEPFKQRIAALENLGKMDADVIRKYVTHRIQVAGGTAALISDTGWEALSIAFNSSGGGIPRAINSLCDRSFQVAFERGKLAVDAQNIYEATQRLGLRTDVFHYIVSLNARERKSQEHHPAVNKPVAETAPPDKEQSSPSIAREAEQGSRKTTSKISDTSGIRIGETGTSHNDFDDITKEIEAKYNKKSFEVPVVLLLASIAACILSVLFFCHRVDSAGILDCLTDLFSV
jgi:general secretion pathway protein A